VFIILAYAPILLWLPVLLLAGVVFVVVPGGFIVVLGGLYYMAVALTGVLGLAVRGRSRDRSSRGRRGHTSVENASRSGRSSLGPHGGIASTPVAVALTNARAVGSAVPQPQGRTLPSPPARKDSFAHPSSSGSESRA
jgi:hypothetical protein